MIGLNFKILMKKYELVTELNLKKQRKTTQHAFSLLYITLPLSKALYIFTASVKGTHKI